jgi:hypothetical protein
MIMSAPSSRALVVKQPQFTRVEGADILMKSRELAGIVPAVIRQQIGHTGAAMTRLHSDQIPMEQVATAFSSRNRRDLIELEGMENEAAA